MLTYVYKGLKFLTVYLAIFSTAKGQSNECFNDITNPDGTCGQLTTRSCLDNFDIGKGLPTTSTTRWMLGEFHERHDEALGCIEDIAIELNLNEYQILLEGVPAGKKIPCELNPKPQQKITCMGWDDRAGMDLMYDVLALNESLFKENMDSLKTEYESISTISHAALYMDKYLEKLLLTSFTDFNRRTVRDHLDSDYTVRVQYNEYKNTIKRIQEQRKNGLSYEKIFSDPRLEQILDRDPSPEVNAKIRQACILRNQSLIRTLRANPGKVSFVISGIGHFLPPEPSLNCASQYIQDELEKDKEDHPYVILGMN